MTLINFEQKVCERIRRLFDSYQSNELAVETCLEIQQHLERCAGCSAELAERERMREQLKAAVQRAPVPDELEERIRARLRQSDSPAAATIREFRPPQILSFLSGRPLAGAAAIAAMIMLFAGGWAIRNALRIQPQATSGDQIIAQQVNDQSMQILGIGVGDHIWCADEHGNRDQVLTRDEMVAESGQWAGLMQVVEGSVPAGFKLNVAHQCAYQGREFTHLILRNQAGNVMSVILTKKRNAEWLNAANGGTGSGLPVWQARMRNYEVAGFEAGSQLGFVISDLDTSIHQLVARAVAPVVHRFATTISTASITATPDYNSFTPGLFASEMFRPDLD